MQLDGKTVVITGANGGLGTSVTGAFLSTGAKVIGVARKIGSHEFSSPSFTPIQADLSSRDSANQLIAKVLESHRTVDVMVHLVGAFAGGKSIEDTDDALLDQMFDLNFRSAFFVLHAVLPVMLAQRSGCLLAIGSRNAVEPAAHTGAYSASKAALISLVGTVAQETKSAGITANVVLPSTLDTPANRAALPKADFSKWVPPVDVAQLLVHLAGNSSITGAVIPIYGRV